MPSVQPIHHYKRPIPCWMSKADWFQSFLVAQKCAFNTIKNIVLLYYTSMLSGSVQARMIF